MDSVHSIDKKWVIPILNLKVERSKDMGAGKPLEFAEVKIQSGNLTTDNISAGTSQGKEMNTQQAIYYMLF